MLSQPVSSASLRAKAIAALARREHSRSELKKKLAHLAESEEQLTLVLDELQREGLLSDNRFAESVARTRGARFGAARIQRELQQKGVQTSALVQAVDTLRASESERLHQVWKKKFGVPPASLQDHARQYRFLAQRGFSSEAISRLLKGLAQGS